MISVHFQGKPYNTTVIQVYAPTINAKEAEGEDIQDFLEQTEKDVLFIRGDWNTKVASQEIPGITGKFGLGLNKGLSEYQRRDSQLWTSPSLIRGRETGRQQPEPVGGNLGPRDGILYQIVSRLPVANQVFLGSWMVDIWEKSAPQRRLMTHLRRHSSCAPRKLRGWDWGGDKMYCPPGESAPTKHLVA